MNKGLGILTNWECPNCGNIIKITSPFWNKKMMKQIDGPARCGCGRKGRFRLINFEPCEYRVVTKKDEKEVETTEEPEEVEEKEEEKVAA